MSIFISNFYLDFYNFFLLVQACNNSTFLPLQEQVVLSFIQGEVCAHLRIFGNHFQSVHTDRETLSGPKMSILPLVFGLHGSKTSKITGFVHGHSPPFADQKRHVVENNLFSHQDKCIVFYNC